MGSGARVPFHAEGEPMKLIFAALVAITLGAMAAHFEPDEATYQAAIEAAQR